MSYIQGYLMPVKVENKEAYIKVAKQSAEIFLDHGVTQIVEGWGDELMDGKVTDFKKAVLLEEGENVVFAWAIWPDKQTYKDAQQKVENDPRWADLSDASFDGKRMVWSGFETILDLSK